MRKVFASLLIVVLLSVAFSNTVYAHPINATMVIARGEGEVGAYVNVSNDDEYITVMFWTKAWPDRYCIVETHLHLAATLEEIPQNDGGAIPGQFDYGDYHDPCVTRFTYTIPLGEFEAGQTIFIAAHAVIRLPDGTEETAWGARCGCLWGAQFPGANWSSYITYTIQPH